ncbi:unnamed protein product [Allacma fusca]|uniref:Uncharacterized protein n=1 Tax=Allacma fusca TaxID=39272 RepID=A0A8J2L9Q0_9HEXA|nr:unnamed protein product [Allacma fusca]
MDKILERLESMDKKLDKIETMEKKLDKIDEIFKTQNYMNGLVRTQQTTITTLESMVKTQTEEICTLKTAMFQIKNDQKFVTNSDRSLCMIVKGLSAPSRNSQTSAKTIIKTELLPKICDSSEEESEVAKWFDTETIVPKLPATNPNKNLIYKLKFKQRQDILKFRSKCQSLRIKAPTIRVTDDLSKPKREVMNSLLKKRKELKEKSVIGHLYANRYLIVKTNNGDEFHESNGTEIIKINAIPNFKPKAIQPRTSNP